MFKYSNKSQENRNEISPASQNELQSDGSASFQFIDNRPENLAQRKLEKVTQDVHDAAQLNPSHSENEQGQETQDKMAFQLKSSEQAPIQMKHDIFNTQNMLFATNDSARLPSFYFSSDGKESWRIRQQHNRGPTIEKKGDNVQHYFFKSYDEAHEFFTAARANDLQNAQKVNRSVVPHTDDYHVEYPVGRMAAAHISGGRIIQPQDFSYGDDEYENMAKAVGKWKEEESKKKDFRENKNRGSYKNTRASSILPAP